MRIQHNIMAMSAYRNYTNNVSAMKSNLEKLSSGYKINRAGDDAAGLAISEKMRAQITGLETAQKNAKDGISLVQTAEGALTEVHDMLNRMVELATQSANGTYDNDTDRYQLQKEMDQLREEIDRIADSSNFNGIQLLDGSMDANGTVKSADTSVLLQDIEGAFTAVADGAEAVNTAAKKGKYVIDYSDIEFTASAASAGDKSVTVSIKVGGMTVAEKSVSVGATVTAGTFGTISATTGTFSNSTVAVSYSGSAGKITMELAEDPTTQTDVDAFNGGLTVEISNGVNSTNNGGDPVDIAGNQGYTLSVKPEELAALKDQKLYAQASIDLSKLKVQDGSTLTIGSQTYTFALGSDSKVALTDKDGNAVAGVVDLTSFSEYNAAAQKAAAQKIAGMTDPTEVRVTTDNNSTTINLVEKNIAYDKTDLVGSSDKADATWKATAEGGLKLSFASGGAVTTTKGKSLTLQIGDTAADYNQLKVNINDCHTSAMGDGTTSIADISIADQDSAAKALDVIKAAINYVSDVRGTLGATQNRLDHTINNLSVMTENIQDAESTIRDVDVAEEMMAYTKNNILIQASQAMLAQANQVPQGVLQLLQ